MNDDKTPMGLKPLNMAPRELLLPPRSDDDAPC
jgi:hypothetical protein